jgi:exodeoxyribonuclease V alpha subunit
MLITLCDRSKLRENLARVTVLEELEGCIESIVFSASETGFTVARFETTANEVITIVGSFPSLSLGQSFKLSGYWRSHPRYGDQFQVEQYSECLPETLVGIEKYLGSGMIRGVGVKTAQQIVDTFGLETFSVMETEIERLLEIPGISEKKLAVIRQSWDEQRQTHSIMIFLQSYGIAKTQAIKVFKRYGPEAIAAVSENPYQLAIDVRGIGFHSADGIASQLGIAPDSEFRYRSAILHVLREAGRDGHCFLPQPTLVNRTVQILANGNHTADQTQIETQLTWLTENRELYVEESRKHPGLLGYYLPAFYRAEVTLAEKLGTLLKQPLQVDETQIETWLIESREAAEFPLSEAQCQAVRLAASQRVVILTGGPGVGKSHTTRAIVEFWESLGHRIALASPTGRAAQRLAELTGREATTLHRLLEYDPMSGRFQRDDQRPILAEAIIVDEFSMSDLFLSNSLVKAIALHAQLLIVGDVDQLPSVGPGSVLRDLIASEQVPVIRLDQVWRQAEASALIRHAHAINRGEVPEFELLSEQPQSDCIWVNVLTPQRGIQVIQNLIQTVIPGLGWNTFTDVQILCPMIKSDVGTKSLNTMMQSILNPAAEHELDVKTEQFQFRLGDRIIQLENDYDRGVMNGELGLIVAYNSKRQQLEVQFDGRVVKYDRSDFDEIALAYSITGHKAQGSEFPVTIVPLFMQNSVMLSRPWFYTTLTRAKRLAILVGQRQAIEHAVMQCSDRRRYTLLAHRLQEAISPPLGEG